MDAIAAKEVFREGLRKYRYVLLAALAGILLMVIPEKKPMPQPVPQESQAASDLEASLARILSQVEGAGTVEVLLTEQTGERTLYQTDEDTDEMSVRRDTVVVTDADRQETGLIRQVDPPVYRGAVVVCRGGDQAQVRLALVEAVKSATGLSADRITVLKMK